MKLGNAGVVCAVRRLVLRPTHGAYCVKGDSGLTNCLLSEGPLDLHSAGSLATGEVRARPSFKPLQVRGSDILYLSPVFKDMAARHIPSDIQRVTACGVPRGKVSIMAYRLADGVLSVRNGFAASVIYVQCEAIRQPPPDSRRAFGGNGRALTDVHEIVLHPRHHLAILTQFRGIPMG